MNTYKIEVASLTDIEDLISRMKLYRTCSVKPVLQSVLRVGDYYLVQYTYTSELTTTSELVKEEQYVGNN